MRFFSLILLVSYLVMAGSYSRADTITGLVGWWPFEGNLNDLSGRSQHGTAEGAFAFVPGARQQAVTLGGDPDCILLDASNTQAMTSEVTLSLWLKFTVTDRGRLVVMRRASGSTALGIGVNESGDGSSVPDGTVNGRYRNASGAAAAISSVPVNDGNWHHVVFTIEGSNGILYLDGAVSASVTDVNNADTFGFSNDSAALGCFPQEPETFGGDFDDVRFYNRALTQKDVTFLYTGKGSAVINNAILRNLRMQ